MKSNNTAVIRLGRNVSLSGNRKLETGTIVIPGRGLVPRVQ